MEKNVIPAGDQPIGAITTENMLPGRFVCLTSHSFSTNYGSLTDVPGIKTPDNSTEAARARYVVAWAPPSRPVSGANPLYVGVPSYPWALREGWDRDENLPMSVAVHTTDPSQKSTAQTIPSGYKAVLLGAGAVVTLASGEYVYSAEVETPGNPLEALNSGDDGESSAGKLAYNASGTIAEVVEFNSTNAALTVRIVK